MLTGQQTHVNKWSMKTANYHLLFSAPGKPTSSADQSTVLAATSFPSLPRSAYVQGNPHNARNFPTYLSAFALIGSEWSLTKIGSVPFLAMPQSRLRTGGSKISNNVQQIGQNFGAFYRFWQVGNLLIVSREHLLIPCCSDHMSPTMSALRSF